jgi:hypothetical protein
VDLRLLGRKYSSTFHVENMQRIGEALAAKMIPDPFINDTADLPKPPEKRIAVNLDAVGDEAIADEAAATKVSAEIVAFFERQKRWKPVKTQSLRAFAVARFYTNAATHIPTEACKAIAHALGTFAYVSRRVRATNAALLEADAWARQKAVSVDELARRVGLSPRTLHYLRGKYGYQLNLASGMIVTGSLKEQGLLDGRRTDNLADYLATPALRFLADPEESEITAQSTLTALRRFGGEPPLKLRTAAYDLVVSYSLVFEPVPRQVLEVLAAALCLVNLRKPIPYVGKD